MGNSDSNQSIVKTVKSWIEKYVIGLNLCPFAKLPFKKDTIRFVVELEDEEQLLFRKFWEEIELLDTEEHSTSIIIYPKKFTEFLEYLDFYYSCEALIEKFDRTVDYQLASFHPSYQFADAEFTDVSNYTNRSPYPVIQILRCVEVEKAVEQYGDTDKIFEQNIALMEKMGLKKVRALLIKK